MTVTQPAGVHVETVTGVDPNHIEWTRTVVWADRDRDTCGRCGEPIAVEVTHAPVMVDWGVPDAPWATHDHRHGCGQWWTVPTVQIDSDDEAEIADAVRWCAAELAAGVEREREAVRGALVVDLAAAADRLAQPLEVDETAADRDDEVLRDLDVCAADGEAGVGRVDGVLTAWAPDPAGCDEEGITVTAQERR